MPQFNEKSFFKNTYEKVNNSLSFLKFVFLYYYTRQNLISGSSIEKTTNFYHLNFIDLASNLVLRIDQFCKILADLNYHSIDNLDLSLLKEALKLLDNNNLIHYQFSNYPIISYCKKQQYTVLSLKECDLYYCELNASLNRAVTSNSYSLQVSGSYETMKLPNQPNSKNENKNFSYEVLFLVYKPENLSQFLALFPQFKNKILNLRITPSSIKFLTYFEKDADNVKAEEVQYVYFGEIDSYNTTINEYDRFSLYYNLKTNQL
jgi:hypothetical protein